MADEKRVFDVAKPGSSKPETGTKPMVVGHKMIKDPTLKEVEDDPVEETVNIQQTVSKTIKPLEKDEIPESNDEKKDTKDEEKPAEVKEDVTEKPETKTVELQIYRIIQEALNNTSKHGQANAAKVSLIQSKSGIFIEIKDNGTGFDVNQQLKSSKSFGLHSLFQRAKSISCILSISSSDKGTSVQLVKKN